MPVETLKTELVKEPKRIREAVYGWLYANKRDVALELRPVLEARRGIVRNAKGEIIRSKKWKKERLELMQVKVDELQNRLKNAKAEIKQLKAELGE